MSQSPHTASGITGARGFKDSLAALDRMIFQGRSFSGRERNCTFLNTGGSKFSNISAVSGFDFSDDGRAVGAVDWDLDGDLDFWVVNRTAPQVRFLRNDSPSENHFVALRLQGRTSNRDAIGARLRLFVAGQGQPLIKTLHAGDGFLSQSSKWVHFGLGKSIELKRLSIWWPGGDVEDFHGLQADRRYEIVQGSGTAKLWSPPERSVHLVPSRLRGPDRNGSERMPLAARAPLPILEYRDFENGHHSLPKGGGNPMLINLWASWCSPCAGELQELAQWAPQLRAEDLEIIALSVDGLGDDGSSEEAAGKFRARFDFPFTWGMANPMLLDKLEILQNRLFDVRRPFSLPSSFLVDARGELATIYRGPVRVGDLLADLKSLEDGLDERRRTAAPFPGRWATQAPRLSLGSIAMGFLEGGFLEDAAFYLVQARRILAAQPELSDPSYVEANNNLGVELAKQGRLKEAVVHYREALRIDPDSVRAHSNLGAALAARGEIEKAIPHIRKALQIKPDDPELRSNLGAALFSRGFLDQAVVQLRKVLETNPGMARTQYILGLALARQGNRVEATTHLRRALELAALERDAGLAAQIRRELRSLEMNPP